MADYHPLDSRYKGDISKRAAPVSAGKSKPWRVAKEVVEPWQRSGPIKDDPRVEQRKREAMSRDIEAAELRNGHWPGYYFPH